MWSGCEKRRKQRKERENLSQTKIIKQGKERENLSQIETDCQQEKSKIIEKGSAFLKDKKKNLENNLISKSYQ